MSVRVRKVVNNTSASFSHEDSMLLSKLFTFQCKDGFNPRIMKKVDGAKVLMMLSDSGDILLPLHLGNKYVAAYAQSGVVVVPNNKIRQARWVENITLRDYQIAPFNEIYTMLTTHGSAIMNLYTGFGKTLLSATLSQYLGVKTLVLVSGTIFESSWVSSYKDNTTAIVAVVPVKSKWKKKATKRSEPTEDTLNNADVIICLVSRMILIPNHIRAQIGTLIVDEADTFCTKARIDMMMTISPTYLLMMTATTKRQNGADKALDIMCGADNKVVMKITKPLKVDFLHTGIVPEFKRIEGVKSWPSVMESLMNNSKRNNYIVSLIQWQLSQGLKVLVLFSLVKHLEVISRLLTQCGVPHGNIYGLSNEYKETMCLLGTGSKVGRGFDEKSFSKAWNGIRISRLLLCNTIKAEASFLQYIGRAERSDSAQVYVIVDNDPSILKHKKEMIKILNTRGNTTITTSHV